MLISIPKEQFKRDLKKFVDSGHKEQFDKFYKRIPKTKCEACGVCCTDSPIITYPEFLYAMNGLINEADSGAYNMKELLQKTHYAYIMGLIKTDIPCPFLDNDNQCLIYKHAPISCKAWGLQSEQEYQKSLTGDHSRNREYERYYLSLGIELSNEVVNFQVPYCGSVEIVKNPYNVVSNDFKNFTIKKLAKIAREYSIFAPDWSLISYLSYLAFGKDVYHKRIELIKQYQNGDIKVVDNYVSNYDYTDLL